jgi:hypothetical protein
MIGIEANEGGEIILTSKVSSLQFEVGDNHFYDYPAICWVSKNVAEDDAEVEKLGLVLKENADDLRDAALLAWENERIALEAEEERAAALIESHSTFIAETNLIKLDYTQAEIDSWPTQEAEAVAFTQDAEAATPLLDAIIAETSETKEALAAKIIEKAGQFKQAFGASLGKKRKAEQT